MNRPGFRRVLLAVADAYKNRREDLTKTAESLGGCHQEGGASRARMGPFKWRLSTSNSAQSRNCST